MKYTAILFTGFLLAGTPLHAQRSREERSEAESRRLNSLFIPQAPGIDTVFNLIFKTLGSEREPFQRYGWSKPSSQIPLDSFYEASKQWCVERMGSERFYRDVRVDWHSFKEESAKDIYYIRFYFFPEGLTDAMAIFTFRYYYFMGQKQIYPPENLRDLRLDAEGYHFPVTQAQALQIARDSVVGAEATIVVRRPEFTDDFRWRFSVDTGRTGIKSFFIDARTGAVQDLKVSRRID